MARTTPSWTKEPAPKYVISPPVLASVETSRDACCLAASGTTPQGNFLYDSGGAGGHYNYGLCRRLGHINDYFKGLVRSSTHWTFFVVLHQSSIFFFLANITSGVLTRHLSNPMTTYTKLSGAETPGISVHSDRRISKINPNIYAGFTEYVHYCSAWAVTMS